MLRGAISGFGEVAARAHLAGWRERTDVRIVAIHEPAAVRRRVALNLLSQVRVYDDLELMLDGERLDFVDVASPPAYHAPTALRALSAGAHVLIEKPLCLDHDTLRALKGAAERAGRVLMCVHNWKHAPPYRRAHELIATGRLGAVTRLALERLRSGPAGEDGTTDGARWRLDSRLGGGILIDHGWHAFYLMQWLMGGRPQAVSAELGLVGGSNVDDVARLTVEFSTGIALAHLSWRERARATTARIEGTAGRLEIDGNRLTLRSQDGLASECSAADEADDSYHASWFAGMVSDFMQAVAEGHGGPSMTANLVEVESAIRLIDAARRSAAADRRVIPLSS